MVQINVLSTGLSDQGTALPAYSVFGTKTRMFHLMCDKLQSQKIYRVPYNKINCQINTHFYFKNCQLFSER